jgi:hypothetical protein
VRSTGLAGAGTTLAGEMDTVQKFTPPIGPTPNSTWAFACVPNSAAQASNTPVTTVDLIILISIEVMIADLPFIARHDIIIVYRW